jgi:hypothetical protein
LRTTVCILDWIDVCWTLWSMESNMDLQNDSFSPSTAARLHRIVLNSVSEKR